MRRVPPIAAGSASAPSRRPLDEEQQPEEGQEDQVDRVAAPVGSHVSSFEVRLRDDPAIRCDAASAAPGARPWLLNTV